MSERRDSGCLLICILVVVAAHSCADGIRSRRVERDVTEIKKALNLPAEPEKEEAK